MAAWNVMEGARGGADWPEKDIDRAKSHLAKYYAKMGESAPCERPIAAGPRRPRVSGLPAQPPGRR